VNSHTIDAKTFQKLFLAGANRINSRKDYINELNVSGSRWRYRNKYVPDNFSSS
jgi:hypothetical protein